MQVVFNGQATTFPDTSEVSGMSIELSGLMLRIGEVFPFSIQVENELGNSTQMDISIAILGRCVCV